MGRSSFTQKCYWKGQKKALLVCQTGSMPSCLWRGTGGDGDPRRWVAEKLFLTLHCHCHSEFCIMMGIISSSESHLLLCELWGAKSQDSIYEPPDAILSPPQQVLHYDGWRWESFWSSVNCKGQSHKTVSLNHNFWRKRRAEVGSWTGACLTATPNWLTKNLSVRQTVFYYSGLSSCVLFYWCQIVLISIHLLCVVSLSQGRISHTPTTTHKQY